MTNPEEQAEITAAKVAAVLALLEAGELKPIEFSSVVSYVIYGGMAAVYRWADANLRLALGLLPLGLTPSQKNLSRLDSAVVSIMEEEFPELWEREPQEDPSEAQNHASERLERLAVAEVHDSAQRALRQAIEDSGFAYWQRVADPECCDECLKLDGEIQKVTKHFWNHPRCRCSLIPYGERVTEPEEVHANEESIFQISREVVKS